MPSQQSSTSAVCLVYRKPNVKNGIEIQFSKCFCFLWWICSPPLKKTKSLAIVQCEYELMFVVTCIHGGGGVVPMLVSLCKKKENRSFVWWFCKDWSQGTRGHPIDVYFAMSSLKLPPQSLSSVALRAPTSVAETNYFLQCVGGKVYFVFISSFPNHFSVQSPHYSTATDAKRNKGFFFGGGGILFYLIAFTMRFFFFVCFFF